MTDATLEPDPVPRADPVPLAWLRRVLVGEVDGSLLAAVRISFGAVLTWELVRYVQRDLPARRFAEATLHFTYWPFDWVRPLSGGGMTALFLMLAALALFVAVGSFTRVSAALLAAGMTYVFLVERSEYLNHWYLACLLAFLLAVVPAGAYLSVDAAMSSPPRPAVVPRWSLQLLRFQVGIVYFFGGLAKIDADWLAGRPLSMWLASNDDVPLLGPAFANPDVGTVLAWASMAFDLSIAPLMLSARTRRFAFPVALSFHLLNARIFSIGMFPWLMMLLTLVFFPADMPRRVWGELRAGRHRIGTLVGATVAGVLAVAFPRHAVVPAAIIGAVVGGVAGFHLAAGRDGRSTHLAAVSEARLARLPARPVVVFLAVWVAVQVVLPLRHYAYRGNASWTEEGHQFAWRMLLRTKSGTVRFVVTEPKSGRTTIVEPDTILRDDQLAKLATSPDMLVQFAHWLEGRMADEMGATDLVVTADSFVSFNGRDPVPLVDPNVDLTEIPRPWMPPADWILPAPTG